LALVDLWLFDAIVPAAWSINAMVATSLADLGHPVSVADFDIALRAAFVEVFGPAIGRTT
jgi:lipoyl(octanoyl) transferase